MNSNNKIFYATGKRKTCSARIFLKEGNGQIMINNKELSNYFKKLSLKKNFIQLLNMIDLQNQLDFFITVKGGGIVSQSNAIRHGMAKVLVLYCNQKSLQLDVHKKFKKKGFITRDSRIVERKKVGFKKARKREQYSKR